MPPILINILLCLLLPNIQEWNAGARGAPWPPAAISEFLKSATTAILVFSATILGLPICNEPEYWLSIWWNRVCPCKPTAVISPGLIPWCSINWLMHLENSMPVFALITMKSFKEIFWLSLENINSCSRKLGVNSLLAELIIDHELFSIFTKAASIESMLVPDITPI